MCQTMVSVCVMPSMHLHNVCHNGNAHTAPPIHTRPQVHALRIQSTQHATCGRQYTQRVSTRCHWDVRSMRRASPHIVATQLRTYMHPGRHNAPPPYMQNRQCQSKWMSRGMQERDRFSLIPYHSVRSTLLVCLCEYVAFPRACHAVSAQGDLIDALRSRRWWNTHR